MRDRLTNLRKTSPTLTLQELAHFDCNRLIEAGFRQPEIASTVSGTWQTGVDAARVGAL